MLLSAGAAGGAESGLLAGAFIDDDDSTHEPMIEAVAAAGITQGCAAGRYCPDDAITRAQMATFLDRALDLPDGPDAFDDDDGNIHEGAINAIAAAEVTLGCGTGTYCPDNPVSRAEMASFLARGAGAEHRFGRVRRR